MARIRSIKPEFPQSETIGALSRDARLLFVQLWTLVDDEGRARAASRMLASLLYPYDDDAPKLMNKWLSELEAERCIRRYEVDGNSYLEIVNWLKHQKIDRPTPSRLPPYREDSTHPREPSRALDADLGPRTKDQDQGSGSSIGRSRNATRPTADSDFEEFRKVYPKRAGTDPRAPALKKFQAAVRGGAAPAEIIAGARRYADDMRKSNKIGTEFVKQSMTWLGQRLWEDYSASAQGPPSWRDEMRVVDEQLARAGYGKTAGDDRREGADNIGELQREGESARLPAAQVGGR